MSGKLIFLRRTKEETELFGGSVFIDIDGRNVGQLGEEDTIISLEEGSHLIKMYKSHFYNTFIGIAEATVSITSETLLVQYSPPMVVSQPGNIVISDFISQLHLENLVNGKNFKLSEEKKENQKQMQIAEEVSKKNNVWIIILLIVLPAIFWIYYDLMIWDLLD